MSSFAIRKIAEQKAWLIANKTIFDIEGSSLTNIVLHEEDLAEAARDNTDYSVPFLRDGVELQELFKKEGPAQVHINVFGLGFPNRR